MLHQTVEAVDDFKPDHGQYRGHVRISGERWHAISQTPIGADTLVRVMAMDGLTLAVEPADNQSDSKASNP